MKKIKVAEIITRMDWAGSPDIIRIICGSLSSDNYDVKLITGQTRYPSASTKEFLDKFKDNIIVIPFLRREINPFFDILALLSLYRILAKEKFDIVHTHTAKAGALGRLAARLAGNHRIIHMPHGHNFYGYFNPVVSRLIVLIERSLSKITDKFITLSELEKKDLIEFSVAKEEKIETVFPGIALEFEDSGNDNISSKKKEFGFDIDHKIVGMVSRLELVKGPEYFVEAAAKVARRIDNARFLVVGEGSLRKKLENKARENGIGDKMVFAGWREDVKEIMPIFDILVLSSLNEAVGRVILEAGAAGKPVVATAVGGVPEIVKDKDAGILVPPGDSESIACAVMDLLRNEEKRNSMGRYAREWVRNNFDEKKMVNGVDNIYRELLKR